MRYLKTTTIIGLLFLFVACHKEDIAEEVRKDHTMMSFEPQMEIVGESWTRGRPVTDAKYITDMGVFVYNTGNIPWATAGATATSNIMNNVNVHHSAGSTTDKWDYAPLIPWLLRYNTCFAYAPYATTVNGITVQSSYTGAPTIQYTTPSSVALQPDLMVAARQEDKYLGTVSFEMEHALACVGFKVNGRYLEKISVIRIKGVSRSGTLSLDHTTGDTPLWTNLAAPSEQEYTVPIREGIVGDGTLIDVMKTDGYLMMIPQILGANAKLIVMVDGFTTKEVSLAGKEWKAGERYTYNIDVIYDPIDIGYFGGWDDVNKVYTKRLQVDWEIPQRDPKHLWAAATLAAATTAATNKHYGPTNINILKGLSPDLADYPAAQYCYLKNDKNNDGLVKAEDGESEDWYLPSQNQMMAVWLANEGIPSKFRLLYNYQCSTDYAEIFNTNWTVNFSRDGETNGQGKQAAISGGTRCVRDLMP